MNDSFSHATRLQAKLNGHFAGPAEISSTDTTDGSGVGSVSKNTGIEPRQDVFAVTDFAPPLGADTMSEPSPDESQTGVVSRVRASSATTTTTTIAAATANAPVTPTAATSLPLIVRRLPSGAVVTEDPGSIQPYRVTTWPDGTRMVEHYLDNIRVIHQPDGTRITTFADGSVVRTFPSGKKLVSRP